MQNYMAAVFSVGILALVAIPSAFADHDRPAGLVFCGHGPIIQGAVNTIQSMCDYNVSVPGIMDEMTYPSSAFPLSFDVQLFFGDGSSTSVFSSNISRSSLMNDNITGQVGTDELPIPDGDCDNREVTVLLTLSSVDASESFQRKLKRRIMCDFSGVDLSLNVGGIDPNNLPTINLDETKTNLKDGMMASFSGVTVAASNPGSPLPSLVAPSDSLGLPMPQAGVFATAFIKQYQADMILTQADCQTAFESQPPEITGRDIVLETALFTTDSELASLDLFEQVKANEQHLELCGEHVLVLMLDPLHTVWNEENRCNNFLTIRINSSRSCDAIMPQCEVIMNPWTPGDVRAVFRGVNEFGPAVRMFQMEDSWVKEVDKYSRLENHGFGRLRLLADYINKHVVADSSACSSFPDPVEQLLDIEGGEPSTEALLTTTLPDTFLQAKSKLAELKDSTAAPADVLAAIDTDLKTLLTSTPQTLGEKVRHNITMQALKYVKNVAEKLISGVTADMVAENDHCELAWEIGGAQWMHNARKDEVEHHLVYMAGNVAYAVIANPQMVCMENLLKNLIDYADKADMASADAQISADFIFDETSRNEENPESLSVCGDTNKCIKKFVKGCRMKHMANWESLENNKEEICRLFIMKRTARSLYRALGMFDLFKEIQSNDEKEGKFCGRDPLKPQSGPVTMWKVADDTTGQTFVYSGMPDTDNAQMSWRKTAVCRCQSCMSEDSSTTTTATPLVRRRRK